MLILVINLKLFCILYNPSIKTVSKFLLKNHDSDFYRNLVLVAPHKHAFALKNIGTVKKAKVRRTKKSDIHDRQRIFLKTEERGKERRPEDTRREEYKGKEKTRRCDQA